MITVDDAVELETEVWRALQSGDSDADMRLLSEDFLGVYPTGFADRADHAGQLAIGPTIEDFAICEPRLLVLSESHVLLTYRAEYCRQGTAGGEDAGIDVSGADTPFGESSNCTKDAEATLFDGIDPDAMVCQTVDGTPLEPTEMMINAIVSKIRRVVITAASEKVDLGKARLFTGMARHAVKLKSTCCVWPGCKVPTSDCQSDHLVEHSKDGRTNPENGAPLCGKHNRLKQRGFTIYRTPDGRWHTIRPDGTEIPNYGGTSGATNDVDLR